MLNASETTAAAAATVAASSSRETAVDPALFSKELGTKMSQAMDKVAAALEQMAAAFPGATISTRAASQEYTVRTGANSSINLSPEMMQQMADDQSMFDKVKEMIAMLFEAGEKQQLVNAGGTSTQRNVTIQEGQIRYVEVQRSSSGTQLSVSSLSLENEKLIAETLDKLLAGRNSGAAASQSRGGFESIVNGSSLWRLQSFVSFESMGLAGGGRSGSWNGGLNASTQMLRANQSFTASLEVVIQQWTESGTRADLMSYIEIMGLSDPLVLDLGGEGINLRSAEDGVYFDIKGDGSPSRTAFIQGNNAFLYLDNNGNGVVDDVGELFGDYGGYANGFEKLAQYDDNGDGVIDEKDAVYSQLRVWRDRNGDGVNQAEESMSLAEAGVSSINLNYQNKYMLDAHGNVIGERSTFTRSDGSTGQLADVWLRSV